MTVWKMTPRFRGLIIVFPGAGVENSKASRIKLKRVIPGQNDAISNMHNSSFSFSDAANPPEKKGKKLWNAGIPQC